MFFPCNIIKESLFQFDLSILNMNISQNIFLSNIFDSDVYNDNEYNSFENNITLDFLPNDTDEIVCEIALQFFECFQIKNTKLNVTDYDLFKKHQVQLIRVCLNNHAINNFTNDDCVCEFDTNFKLSIEISKLVYIPIILKRKNVFCITLKNEKNDLIQLSENYIYCVRCIFHLRTMSILQTKLLRLRSDNEASNQLYSENTVFKFKTKIYPSFHENEDFTKWEVAVESIFISEAILKALKTATLCVLDCGTQKSFCDSGQSNQMLYATLQVKNSKKIRCSYIKPSNLIFFNVTKRLLDEVPVNVKFYNGATRLHLNEYTNDMLIIVNLLFRRIYTY